MKFEKELEDLINKHCIENESNTPDFLLSLFLRSCLNNLNKIIKDRDKWYHGEVCAPGQSEDKLTASEAVYGFAAWLTTREVPVYFSVTHNAGIAAELVNEFCKANNLKEPRDNWHTHLVHPSGEVAVGGRGTKGDGPIGSNNPGRA